MLTFHLVTIFPEIFDSYLKEGILARALEGENENGERKVAVKVYNLRDFANDKHRTVDDTPYGGGAGMVLKVEPIYRALESIKKDLVTAGKKGNETEKNIRTILLAAKGQPYNQTRAAFYQQNFTDLILICGRYEGIDERVAQYLVDEELSIGPFILSGGELPALTVVDSITRLVPGVLGNQESLESESFNPSPSNAQAIPLTESDQTQLDYPVYTKPEEFQGWKVPEVLLSGHHANIEKWRQEQQRKA
jgi:tRNA (guanine37-N1)-methyltransferase